MSSRGEEEPSKAGRGFSLVATEMKYPQRSWQVPTEFFRGEENINRDFIVNFFKNEGITLSREGVFLYMRSNHVLMVADTKKNLRKIDALIRKYVKSVEAESWNVPALSPAIECGELVEGKLKSYPYPSSLVTSFFAGLDYASGKVPEHVGGYYLLVLEKESGVYGSSAFSKNSRRGKKERRKAHQHELRFMKAFQEQSEIACIVVLGEGCSMSDVPDDCSLPVIRRNRIGPVVERILNKGKKGRRGTARWEDDDDTSTREGRFFFFLRYLDDVGVREGLYNRYGRKVDSLSTREEMLKYLQKQKED